MQWIASNLNRGDPIEKARVFELKDNDLHIIIHKHFAFEWWLLTCKILDIDCLEIDAVYFNEAVKKAKQIIQ